MGGPTGTDFGQSRFGQSIFGHRGFGPAKFGQNQFWPVHFWQSISGSGVSWPRRVGAPKGGRSKISRFFFVSHHQFRFFFVSHCVSSRGFLVVFEALGP